MTTPAPQRVIQAAPIAAASIILLRDGAAGPEVFLMRRAAQSDQLGGNYVFPGGKIDPADASEARLSQLGGALQTLQAALAEPGLTVQEAGALYLGAARELHEEAGVELHPADLPHCLAPWSRWITPRMPSHAMTKRFDTRFFVARMPDNQHAQHDNHETTESLWLTPRVAIHRYWDGHMAMMPPQVMSLAHLSRFESVAAVFSHAVSRPPPTIEPEPFDDAEGVRVVCYPGDPVHPLRDRVMPGPTRLCLRNGRFEPEGGLAALFD